MVGVSTNEKSHSRLCNKVIKDRLVPDPKEAIKSHFDTAVLD
jgi:hypothetical protein